VQPKGSPAKRQSDIGYRLLIGAALRGAGHGWAVATRRREDDLHARHRRLPFGSIYRLLPEYG